ncbi:MAG: hypothetical protein U5L96_10595 [Owenweeksia sp.]|nr:hypothetical protein [Owenweeksia sp.]
MEDTAWNNPAKQVPTLVRGTLMSGHPNSSFEILSELRMLAYALGQAGDAEITEEEATAFLEEVVVHNLEFAFDELTEESRTKLTQQERRKVVARFKFLMEKANLSGIKAKLAKEDPRGGRTAAGGDPYRCATLYRRCIKKWNWRMMIRSIKSCNTLWNALYFPGPMVVIHPSPANYKEVIGEASKESIADEASEMGQYLHSTQTHQSIPGHRAAASRREISGTGS